MTEFVTGIVDVITALFAALLEMLAGLGTLVFNVAADGGAITGLTPFGWLTAILVAIPLATWLFNKAIGIFNRIFKR